MLIKNVVQSHVKNKDFVHLDSENVGETSWSKTEQFRLLVPFSHQSSHMYLKNDGFQSHSLNSNYFHNKTLQEILMFIRKK